MTDQATITPAPETLLRAYFFGNMYLKSIQQGIQAAHVVTKMFLKHGLTYGPNFDNRAYQTLHDWAEHGVTKILLDGGYQDNIADVYKVFEHVCPLLGLPFAKFHEEQAALNGALTSAGVVVPEEIYKMETASFTQMTVDNYIAGTMPPMVGISTPQDVLRFLEQTPTWSVEDREVYYKVLLSIVLKSARLAS